MLNCTTQEMLSYIVELLETYTVEEDSETNANDRLALDAIANIARLWNAAEG